MTTAIAIRSPWDTPTMSPNRAASKSRVKVLYLLIRAMPRAKLAVVMMPMAASAPICLFLVARVMSRADRNPQIIAPARKLKDKT